jgi:hypothetical protein
VRTLRTPAVATAALLLAAGCASAEDPEVAAATSATAAPAASELPTVVVHKTESCECCGVYEDYLEELGVDVDVVIHEDIGAVKDDLGVPVDQRSCHTNQVEGYFVEGHVPVEAIAALLAEAPEVDGIALAGMPSGSPGMPGEQLEPFVVTTAIDGEVVGELGRF